MGDATSLAIKDPLRTPEELDAMLLFLGFDLPAELLAIYHLDFPDPLAGMSADERLRTVF